MHPFKTNLLASTVVPLALAVTGMTAAAVTVVAASRPALSACAPCNPRAAKNPCAAAANPCAAVNPGAAVNPCAVKEVAANPCNPCAAGANAAASSGCLVPELARAAANPCNPCAAKNPCNPCAADNPCGAGAAVELTNAQAAAAYDCVIGQMRAAYGKSGNAMAASYTGWRRYSNVAYQSSTHGERYVQNYANGAGRAYGAFEKAGVMPAGSILAKDSFTVNGKGNVAVGPLFMMEKMPAGFNAESGNWKYTMIMPNGSVFGVTNAKNSSGMRFCTECHAAVAEEQDHMMFLPDEYRTR